MPSSNNSRRPRQSGTRIENERLTENSDSELVAHKADAPKNVPSSKIGQVINGVQAEEGMTLAQLTELTGWLPHTARAALTGLQKKRYEVERSTADGVSIYRITGGQT